MHKQHQYAALGACTAGAVSDHRCGCPRYMPSWVRPDTSCTTCPHAERDHESGGRCSACLLLGTKNCALFVPPRIDPDLKAKCSNCPHAKFVHREDGCVAKIGGDRRPCKCAGFEYQTAPVEADCPFDRDDASFFQSFRAKERGKP